MNKVQVPPGLRQLCTTLKVFELRGKDDKFIGFSPRVELMFSASTDQGVVAKGTIKAKVDGDGSLRLVNQKKNHQALAIFEALLQNTPNGSVFNHKCTEHVYGAKAKPAHTVKLTV